MSATHEQTRPAQPTLSQPGVAIDRGAEARELVDFILAAKSGLVVLYGRYSVGKTTLIRRWVMNSFPQDWDVVIEDASKALDDGLEIDGELVDLYTAVSKQRIVFLDGFERHLARRENEDPAPLKQLSQFLDSDERRGIIVVVMDVAGLDRVFRAASHLPQLLSATREIRSIDVKTGYRTLFEDESLGTLEYEEEFLDRLCQDSHGLTVERTAVSPYLLSVVVSELREQSRTGKITSLTTKWYEDVGGIDALLAHHVDRRIGSLPEVKDGEARLARALLEQLATRQELPDEASISELAARFDTTAERCNEVLNALVKHSGMVHERRDGRVQFVPAELRDAIERRSRPGMEVRKASRIVAQGFESWDRLGTLLPRERFEEVHKVGYSLELEPEAVEFLLHSLPSDAPFIGGSRYWLRRLLDPAARERFLNGWLKSRSENLRIRAAALTTEFSPERRDTVLYELAIKDDSPRVREQALEVLKAEDPDKLRKRLEENARDGTVSDRQAALQALHFYADERNREFLLEQARDSNNPEALREAAVKTLVALDTPEAVDDLRDLALQSHEGTLREWATAALCRLPSPSNYEPLLQWLRDHRFDALTGQRRLSPARIVGALLKFVLCLVLIILNLFLHGLILFSTRHYILGTLVFAAQVVGGLLLWGLRLENLGFSVFLATFVLGYVLPLFSLLRAKQGFRLPTYSFGSIMCGTLYAWCLPVFLLVHGLGHAAVGKVRQGVALFAVEVAALGAFAAGNFLKPMFFIPGEELASQSIVYAYLFGGIVLFTVSFVWDWGLVGYRYVLAATKEEGRRRSRALLRSLLANPAPAKIVLGWARDGDARSKRWARKTLPKHGRQVPREELLELLEHGNADIRNFVKKSLAQAKTDRLVEQLKALLENGKSAVQAAVVYILSRQPTEASLAVLRKWSKGQGLGRRLQYRFALARLHMTYWPKALLFIAVLGVPLLLLLVYHATQSYFVEAHPLMTFIVRNEGASSQLRVTVANFVANTYPEKEVRGLSKEIKDRVVTATVGAETDGTATKSKYDKPEQVFRQLQDIQRETSDCYVAIGLVQSLGIAIYRLEKQQGEVFSPKEKREILVPPLKQDIAPYLRNQKCSPRRVDIEVDVNENTRRALQALRVIVNDVPQAVSDGPVGTMLAEPLVPLLSEDAYRRDALAVLAGLHVLNDTVGTKSVGTEWLTKAIEHGQDQTTVTTAIDTARLNAIRKMGEEEKYEGRAVAARAKLFSILAARPRR